MGFGGPVIKEGIILVNSIVTLQNCFGDLGEICGKYPRWLKVPGPLDIGPFLTQFPILFAYIDIHGFWGARYKRGSNFSYLDCYTPKLFWRPRWDMWQVPKIAESTGTSWYLTLFDPVPYSIHVYWYIWVFGGPVIKEGIILVISIVTLQNCFGDLGEICGKYPRWLKVPGPLDIGPFLTQFPILFAYIDLYGFWGARYKRGYNFSYLDCYTSKLFWRPRWDMWQVPKMAESTGTSWYLTLFDPVPYSIHVYWHIWVLGGPL